MTPEAREVFALKLNLAVAGLWFSAWGGNGRPYLEKLAWILADEAAAEGRS